MIKLPSRKLNKAAEQSAVLRHLLARILLFFVADRPSIRLQRGPFHRAANGSGSCGSSRTRVPRKSPSTHEQFAGLLGIGRSYATRVLQGFQAEGLISTARGELRIRDLPELRRRSCKCDAYLRQNYEEFLQVGPDRSR